MIGVTMWEVADYSTANKNVLKHVVIPSMDDIVHYRRLVWMGKIARMPLDRFPRKFLAAWTDCPIGNASRACVLAGSITLAVRRNPSQYIPTS